MRRIGAFAAVCAVLIATGCGDADQLDQDEETQDLPAPTSPMTADTTSTAEQVGVTLTEWTLTLTSDSVPAGVITFEVVNTGTTQHSFEIEGAGQEWGTDPLDPGGRVSMTVTLEPGEYKVYCPVTGEGESHEARGMVAQLRVVQP